MNIVLTALADRGDKPPAGNTNTDAPGPDEAGGDEGDEPIWVRIDARLTALALEQRLSDHAQGRLLLEARHHRVHEHLGKGSYYEYVERLFGYSPRQVDERLSVAVALRCLPHLDGAFAAGELPWTAVRELARVAVPETEAEWLKAAAGKTVRDIERMVAHKDPGQRPSDPDNPTARLHRITVQVTADVLAMYRDAITLVRQSTGERLSEEEAFAELVRRVLGSACAGGEHEHRDASYQLALTVCSRCGQGYAETGGDLLPVDDVVTERARCDALNIGHVDGSAAAVGEPAPAVDRHLPHVGAREHAADVAGPHVEERSGDRDASQVAEPTGTVVAEATGPTVPHVGDGAAQVLERRSGANGHAIPSKPPRASRSVPPTVRRAVQRRQRGQCVVAGCRGPIHDMHHLRYPQGRSCTEDEIVGVCHGHHARIHEGRLWIQGSASTGLQFHHADGTPYGQRPSPKLHALRDQVESALVNLGFKRRHACEGLAAVLPHVGTTPSFDDLLRAALAALT